MDTYEILNSDQLFGLYEGCKACLMKKKANVSKIEQIIADYREIYKDDVVDKPPSVNKFINK